MSFGTRLKQRREELGMKQGELGALLGVTGSAIGNYENGVSSPKADVLYKVFDALKCDANFLFQDEMSIGDDSVSVQELAHIKKYRALDEHGKSVVDVVMNVESTRQQDVPADTKVIPFVLQSMAAGVGEPDLGNIALDTYEIPAGSKAEFACRVHGDSLEPYYHDGDVALAVKRRPQAGEVGVFLVDGEYKLKQYVEDALGNVYLFALNRSRSDTDQTLLAGEDHALHCLGTILSSKKFPLPR